MIVIACLDAENGMLFNGRRQSRDRRVIQDISEMVKGEKLLMSSYSHSLFANEMINTIVDNDFLSKASPGDFCFVENLPIGVFADKIEKVVIYRWNKKYPQTTGFDLPVNSSNWYLESSLEFPGYSHETIKKEIYYRC